MQNILTTSVSVASWIFCRHFKSRQKSVPKTSY